MDGRVVPVLRPTVERSLLALRDMRRLRESCEDARRAVDGVLPFDYAALGFDDGGVDEQQLLEDNIAITDIALLSARDRLCWHKACLPAASIGSTGSRPRIAMKGVRFVPGIGALRIANSMNLTYFAQSRTEAPDSFTMLLSVSVMNRFDRSV